MYLLDPNNPNISINLVMMLAGIMLSVVAFICFSGFVKFTIILNIIKNAIGVQQVPPNIVVNLLAALMALYSFYPAAKPGIDRITPYLTNNAVEQHTRPPNRHEDSELKPETVYQIVVNLYVYFPELQDFAKQKSMDFTSKVNLPESIEQPDENIKNMLYALLLDIHDGFEIGLKLYMIFVSLDFLIAVILNGIGITMLSPTVISIPIKLAVFYLSNAWTSIFNVL